MAKAKAKGSNKGSLGSMTLGTTPKAKRSDSRTQTGEKPKRRQSTKHLQQYEFQAYGWAVFSRGNKVPNQYTTYELRQIVKRASKAANQRLRKLEAAGVDKWAYKSAQKALGDKRKRYWERTDKKSREELIAEYVRLRDFMTAKTSTLSGIRDYHKEQTERARKLGFTGTDEELSFMYERYMDEEFTKLVGSDIIKVFIMENRQQDLEDLYQIWQEDLKKEQHDKKLGGRILLEAMRRLVADDTTG